MPSPSDECVIRVALAGICGTDLELMRGYADFTGIPGHEFVGTVERAPDRAAAWVGRRVVGEINVACGTCRFCREGVRQHCEHRTVLGIRGRPGAFAEYLTLPPENLHSVPDDLDDERAVFVEPVAAACRILEQVAIGDGTRTVVVGDGRMALIAAQVLRSAGAPVTVVGRHASKLALATRLGLQVCHATDLEPLAKQFDLAVDVSGRPGGLESARRLVRPRGIVVLKSTFHGELAWAPWPVIVDEITLVGSRCGPFVPALALLAAGRVEVRALISGIHRLDEYEVALDAARRQVKVLFSLAEGRVRG